MWVENHENQMILKILVLIVPVVEELIKNALLELLKEMVMLNYFMKNKNQLKQEYLENIVKQNISLKCSILFTDEYRSYSKMNNILNHKKINHKKYFYLNGINTNTIESF